MKMGWLLWMPAYGLKNDGAIRIDLVSVVGQGMNIPVCLRCASSVKSL
jgi:hypothetical protein